MNVDVLHARNKFPWFSVPVLKNLISISHYELCTQTKNEYSAVPFITRCSNVGLDTTGPVKWSIYNDSLITPIIPIDPKQIVIMRLHCSIMCSL